MSNDWGDPLNFGASFQALVFGRDEGFYFRSTGAELRLTEVGNPRLEWRLYGERQSDADVKAEFSIANALGDKDFLPNIDAEDGDMFGMSARMSHSIGQDPLGLRVLSDVRLEHGFGDFGFGRGLFDVTLSRGLGGNSSAALTMSAGTSVGVLPVQRQFGLGGTYTIRGQRPGTNFGDAFWMMHAELGSARIGAKPVLFFDVGWAGSRQDWTRQSRATSGAGIGLSFLDGLIRMDLARGIYPGKAFRFYSYLEARF